MALPSLAGWASSCLAGITVSTFFIMLSTLSIISSISAFRFISSGSVIHLSPCLLILRWPIGINLFEHPDTIKNIWISDLCQATYAKNIDVKIFTRPILNQPKFYEMIVCINPYEDTFRATHKKGVSDKFSETPKWSRRADLNRWPADYESAALPTELRRPDYVITVRGFKVLKANHAKDVI